MPIKWYQTWWGKILLFFFFLLFILIFAFVLYLISPISKTEENKIAIGNIKINNNLAKPSTTPSSPEQIDTPINKQLIEGFSNYFLGSPQAKMSIVEFSDFSCPFSKQMFSLVREIAATYPDQVKITYRFYPTHEDSIERAMAAYCAGEEGKFWMMHDKLFQNQEALNQKNTDLVTLAKEININDLTKFNQCLVDQKYFARLQKDAQDGEQLGVTGTPTWFIDGIKKAGLLSRDSLIKVIESNK